MCSELRPEECHRAKLIGEALHRDGVPVAHVDETGTIVGHEQVTRRLTGGQLQLFGHSFTSRRRYKPSQSQST
jgi:hypothetical protein